MQRFLLQGAPLLPLQPLADVLPSAVSFDLATGVLLNCIGALPAD